MGKLTELKEVYANFPSDTEEGIYLQTYTAGLDIGILARVVTGFKP